MAKNKKRTQKEYNVSSSSAQLLVSKDDADQALAATPNNDRENIVGRMDIGARKEEVDLIGERFTSAKDTTEKAGVKIDEAEKQYKGEWLEPDSMSEERIYLPKTREHVQAVYSYIMSLVSQLRPIVRVEPRVSSIAKADLEYERAKVMEAMLQFYFDDVWNIKTESFPTWLKQFLKHPLAVHKVEYGESDYKPDIRLRNVDRANLYVDPTTKDIKDSRWVIERYFISRSEFFERIDAGAWVLDEMHNIPAIESTGTSSSAQMPVNLLERMFGQNFFNNSPQKADELIEVWDYWQAPKDGLSDVYAVVVGGESGQLVRYGRNPFPYKGIPYRGKSFDPDDYVLDGMSLVEQFSPFQRVINSYFDIRHEDLTKNAIQPVMVDSRFIAQDTLDAMNGGEKMIPMSPEGQAWLEANPGKSIRDAFYEVPAKMSTDNILSGDLPFLMQMGQDSSAISDVFRGQSPGHQATATQIQEQLSRNQGAFKPVYMRVMRHFEELAEIMIMYFKDPEFTSEGRMISVMGEDRYIQAIKSFQNIQGTNTFVKEIDPDDMDVDVMLNAVNQADALASRTFLVSSIAELLQAAGQHPALLDEASKTLNFGKMFEMVLQSSGHDIEALRLTPEQQQERAQQQQQATQASMEEQLMLLQQTKQLDVESQRTINRSKAFDQMAVEANKLDLQAKNEEDKQNQAHDNELEQTAFKITQDLRADIVRMLKEAELEKQAGVDSVGTEGNHISEPKGSNKAPKGESAEAEAKESEPEAGEQGE